jgi:dTDP-glucose 4,6-dehydratase
LRPMKVLVTGGAGFIGSAVCRLLAGEPGWTVTAVDALTYAGNLASLAPVMDRIRFIQADVADPAAMADAFAQARPDAVMHLAAETHVDRSIDAPLDFVRSNITGTAVLLEAARAACGGNPDFRFLQVSTDEVYGSLGENGLFREDSPIDPRSPYSASKAASDHLARAWRHTFGLPTLVSHCGNNYGPCQLPEKLIPLTILNALEGLPLPVYGDGGNVRDWLHVEDHARALVAILTKGRVGETYNVGARSERTNIDIVRQVCDLVDRFAGRANRRELITFVADRPGHDRRYAIDPTRLETELGWRPAESFETGLEKTVRWYLDNPGWWEPLRAQGHGRARLGIAAGGRP